VEHLGGEGDGSRRRVMGVKGRGKGDIYFAISLNISFNLLYLLREKDKGKSQGPHRVRERKG